MVVFTPKLVEVTVVGLPAVYWTKVILLLGLAHPSS